MSARLPLLLLLAIVILLFAAIGLLPSPMMQRFVIDTLIKLVMVVGLYTFVGTSGVLSFGHTSFAMIGAYAAAWVTLPLTTKKIFLPDLPQFLLDTQFNLFGGIVVGVAVALVAAALIGIAVMRLSGIGASIATLAWLIIVYTVCSNADALTRGTSSLVGLPLATGLGAATLTALAVVMLAYLFRFSRYGLMLSASREDEVAAYASGISVHRLRLAAFIVSAGMVALGGVLQAHFLGVVSVGQYYINLTFLALAMLVVGGMKSLAGAVVGTILISGFAEILRFATGGFTLFAIPVPPAPGFREVGLAVLMLLVLLLRPEGLIPRDAMLLQKLRSWRSD